MIPFAETNRLCLFMRKLLTLYSGLLLALCGNAIAIGEWRGLVALVPFAAGVIRKMMIEERFMMEQFGEAYARYRAEVPALVPFVY